MKYYICTESRGEDSGQTYFDYKVSDPTKDPDIRAAFLSDPLLQAALELADTCAMIDSVLVFDVNKLIAYRKAKCNRDLRNAPEDML